MTLRRGTVEDLSYILDLERMFRESGYVGGDEISVHERRLSDPDC